MTTTAKKRMDKNNKVKYTFNSSKISMMKINNRNIKKYIFMHTATAMC